MGQPGFIEQVALQPSFEGRAGQIAKVGSKLRQRGYFAIRCGGWLSAGKERIDCLVELVIDPIQHG